MTKPNSLITLSQYQFACHTDYLLQKYLNIWRCVPSVILKCRVNCGAGALKLTQFLVSVIDGLTQQLILF
jgi:hypothetical protein